MGGFSCLHLSMLTEPYGFLEYLRTLISQLFKHPPEVVMGRSCHRKLN